MDANTLIEALFNEGEDYVVVLDGELRVIRASAGWASYAEGPGFLDTVEGTARVKVRALLEREDRPRRTVLVDHVDPAGSTRRIAWRMVHLPAGLLLLGRDTADETRRLRQILRLHRELHHESSRARLAEVHDPLTGLQTRGAALTSARALWASVPTASLVLLDLDHLGAINRRHGHEAGDILLQVIARALRDAVPEGAVVGRWDGDAFLVAVPGDEKAVASQLLQTVRGARVEGPAGTVGVTASIGAALVAHTDRVPLDDALHAADSALAEVRQTDEDLALVRRLVPRHRKEGPPGNERRGRALTGV